MGYVSEKELSTMERILLQAIDYELCPLATQEALEDVADEMEGGAWADHRRTAINRAVMMYNGEILRRELERRGIGSEN